MKGHSGAVINNCPKKPQQMPVLPRGLVGTKSTGQIQIKGNTVNCLLDTGSQVTTVPHSFYNKYLSDHEIKPLNDLLEIEGANGQSVPYLGYIEINITFPPDFLGSTIIVDTLALVVPDLKQSQSLVLVGTNTLDSVYLEHCDTHPDHPFQPSASGYQAVVKILQHRHRHSLDDHYATLQLNHPCTILAGQTTVLEGLLATRLLQGEKAVVIEHPTSYSLPGGLVVQTCLVDLPASQPCFLPVVVTNESDHPITIPARAIIAEVGAFQNICTKEQSIHSGQSPDMPSLQYDFGDSPLPSAWKQRIINQLNTIPEVFAKHDLDFGRTDKVRHQINLSDPSPFKQRPRPIHPLDVDAVRRHLQELLETGVIRESDSPFASPIVVVRKKNGNVRLCIDYRKLNLQTIKDAYPLPKLEDTFSALSGSKWFSVLDLKSGYYQIEMEETDKAKTAFVCPLGFYEFNRMPQGVTNAPSTFQRLMEKCMGELHLREVLVFIDDLIIFAPTLEEHERRLMRVLNKLKEYGLKLSVEKCKFFQTSVKYLGHVVSENGIETDPDKIKALTSWPVPQNLKELRSFLGFAGYYRRFVHGYSVIVKPLHDLTAGYPPSQKKFKSKIKPDSYFNPKEPFGGRWSIECQAAFESIIAKLTSAPVLAFADPQKPYILHTDASSTGLGAVLYQEQDGEKRVVAYASRGLSKSESNYAAHKLEFLALKWAVTEKFTDYLYGAQFTVVTDSNPLTYLLTSAKLDATSYRWLSALSTFNFKIIYRAGRQNADADGLSRRPHSKFPEDPMSIKERERVAKFMHCHLDNPPHTIGEDVVHAICDRHLVQSSPVPGLANALLLSMSANPGSVPDSFTDDIQFTSLALPQLSPADLAEKQRADPIIRHVITHLERGESPPPKLREELPELPLLLREINKLEFQDNILVRRRQLGNQVTYQLVLPEECRAVVLFHLHDRMGHLGIERTMDLVRSRFFWPRMAADVYNKIKTCERCVKRKALPDRAAPLVNIKTSRPLELVCMDFLSLEPDRRVQDILVITDHFTKYAVAIPTPNQKARTVAKCLWEHFFVHYGIPERLHSDQGPDFESRTIRELCEIAGIHKIRTTPYHPRGNPVERFNRTLLDMLGTLTEQEKHHWRDFVKPLVHAYNCTKNDATGFSPYELMFGRQPRLPVDLAFGLPLINDKADSHSQYIQKLKSHLEESYKMATENSQKLMDRNKLRFDHHVTPSELSIGDRVLVRNVRIRGKQKLADKWEPNVYIVVEKAGNLPVYTVKPEGTNKPPRTLHRDLLLPCGYLPAPEVNLPVKKRKENEKSLTLPSSDSIPVEDEDITIVHAPSTLEPLRFFTVIDLPTAQQPAPFLESSEVRFPPKPSDVENDGSPVTDVSEVAEPAAVDEEVLAVDMLDSEIDFTDTVSEPGSPCSVPVENTQSTIDDSQAEECPPPPRSPGAAQSELDAASPILTSPDSEPVVRRAPRTRKPPDRLQYSRPGQPFLRSIQNLLHSLSSAFTFALDADEDDSGAKLRPPAVRCQPSPCPRTYMGTGGESVTHVK